MGFNSEDDNSESEESKNTEGENGKDAENELAVNVYYADQASAFCGAATE